MKYVRVLNGDISHTSGFKFKIGQENVSLKWNPNADNTKDFGGFNFSTEDKILRYLHRGDTIYDVEIPEDAEVIEVDSRNAPHGIFRTNKIIVYNPRPVTEELVIELYNKSNLPINTYYQCLVTLLYKGHKDAVKYIIKERINLKNIDEAIKEFEEFIVSKDNKKFNYDELWDDAKEIYDILKEIQNELYISLFIDKEPYIKKISNDKVINLTGESGSGKSYFSNKWKNDSNYIVIDTDIIFSDRESDNKESVELRKIFKDKSKDYLITDFDYCYEKIINYFKNLNKTIVIDSAQYRNIKDVSILKGEIIIMRTSIDKCYQRCISRWKNINNDYREEELAKFKNKKLGMYKWYKNLNMFIDKIDKL